MAEGESADNDGGSLDRGDFSSPFAFFFACLQLGSQKTAAHPSLLRAPARSLANMTTNQLLIVYQCGCEMGDTTGSPACWCACLADSSSSCPGSGFCWHRWSCTRSVSTREHEAKISTRRRGQAGDEGTNEQASRSTEPLVETNKV